MVFCNFINETNIKKCITVTILILIDGFLQYAVELGFKIAKKCHNPYFNRWFSAIKSSHIIILMEQQVTILILIDGFLQYRPNIRILMQIYSHNPYFNRWFSAISSRYTGLMVHKHVTILILIDGFLQFEEDEMPSKIGNRHNPYFNRWFSAIAAKISQNFTFLCKKLYLVTVSVNFTLPNLCI